MALKSNFLELTRAQRNEICGENPLLAATERYWYAEPSPFVVVRQEKWWVADPGFHYEPDQLSAPELCEGVLLLEEAATTLAKAAYPARQQPSRVADVALLFLAEATRLANLRALFVAEGCLFVDGCPIAPLVEARQRNCDQSFASALADVIRATSAQDAGDGMALLRVELSDWLVSEFPRWVTAFLLELARWKSAPNLEAQGGEHE